MKRNSYVHCSFDLVESFKPRVPKTRVIGKFVSEEAETPRICTADTIQHDAYHHSYRYRRNRRVHKWL